VTEAPAGGPEGNGSAKSATPPKGFDGRQMELYRGVAGVSTLGREIAIAIGLGLLAGRWADARWGTTPWLQLAGVALGFVVAVKAVVRVMRQMRRAQEEEERREGNPRPLYESAHERAERKQRGEKIEEDPIVEKLPFDERDDEKKKK
jgi:F0F1-type ATP synthase assembly protein I